MREPAGFPLPSLRRRSLIPWLSLFLAPIVAMLPFVSHGARAWLGRHAAHTEPRAVMPGLTMDTAPNPHGRVVVTSIQSGSPVAHRGIAVGDVVLAIDGAPIFSLDQARRCLQKDRDRTVDLRIAHGGRSRDVRLVWRRPAPGGSKA